MISTKRYIQISVSESNVKSREAQIPPNKAKNYRFNGDNFSVESGYGLASSIGK